MADLDETKETTVEDAETPEQGNEAPAAEDGDIVEEGERDDLDESLDAIKEEEDFEDTQYDDDNNYIGDDPEVTDPSDWATPEFTPEGSDIPVTVDLESVGESMIEEGNAILDVLGPSGNDTFDELVLSKDKSTVSYPDPQDTSRIVQEDSDKGEWDGLGFDSDYTEERTYEGDGTQVSNEDAGDDLPAGDDTPIGGDDDVEGGDEEVEFTEDDYEF